MGLERENRRQEASWKITRVAQRDTQLAIIHLAWLAYWDGNGNNKGMLGISL